MRRAALFGLGAAAVVAVGLVSAQTAPAPANDPIADALKAQEQAPQEEAPPAPGELAPPPAPTVPTVVVAPEVPPTRSPPAKADEEAGATPGGETAPSVDTSLRVRHGSAIIQAVDKITAERLRFEAKVGQPVRYKGLVFTVRACETSAPDEVMDDAFAWMEVRAEPRTQADETPSRRVFRGWMTASTPSLNPLQHNVYDAWLIACRDSRPVAVGASR